MALVLCDTGKLYSTPCLLEPDHCFYSSMPFFKLSFIVFLAVNRNRLANIFTGFIFNKPNSFHIFFYTKDQVIYSRYMYMHECNYITY